MTPASTKLKILVAIASYGRGNDRYLAQLVEEYQSMSFDVDIVVLSNVQKEVGPGIEVVVGLPTKNPWTLPFGHKKIFAERVNSYDLFIYSEDDTLITEANITAFLKVSEILPADKIAGFLRFECGANGAINYPDVHGHYHWDIASLLRIGEYQFAHFTNEHSASYVITREQLQKAIESGGFLVEPHEGKYDLLCSAATDPYTQCGFQKVLCISHMSEFMIRHLSAKYVGVAAHVGFHLGLDGAGFQSEIDELLRIGQNGHRPDGLMRPETNLKGGLYSKDFYEAARTEIISEIPATATSVLSVGCGSGVTEKLLAAKGVKVVAVPLDAVVAAGAEAEGVEIIGGDLSSVRKKLARRKFDCLLLSNVLHLVEDPIAMLGSFTEFLSKGAALVIVVPNVRPLRITYDMVKRAAGMAHEKPSVVYWRMLRGDKALRRRGKFEEIGVHETSERKVRDWCTAAGLKLEKTVNIMPVKFKKASGLTLGLFDGVIATELISVATKI
jgi:SAM-dependent methyltransferase